MNQQCMSNPKANPALALIFRPQWVAGCLLRACRVRLHCGEVVYDENAAA